MITQVGTVTVWVDDQDRAKVFYTEKLGLELKRDEPLFPGAENRWVAVAPVGGQTEIILYKADENWLDHKHLVGKSQSLTLAVDDLDATYADLKAKGVEFPQEPEKQPWGAWAMLKDSEGNTIMVVEQPSA